MNLKLPEHNTVSVLDVVKENFARVDLKTYAVRMIYIGEHTIQKEELVKHFRKTVRGVRAGYCDITINGLLLVYDSYFVHIVEGSEDTIHRQLRFLFQNELDWIVETDRLEAEARAEAYRLAVEAALEEGDDPPPPPEEPTEKPVRQMFRRLKMLIVYHSISTMLFENWRAITAKPPVLIGNLDVFGPISEHMEQLRLCLEKIDKLCSLAKMHDDLSFEGLSANDPKMEALPEVLLLDFLLNSTWTLELRYILGLHRRVDDYRFYYEDVWPLANHYTPRHLYKLKIDDSFVEPLPVMPWEVKQKEEEGEGDERSARSTDDSE